MRSGYERDDAGRGARAGGEAQAAEWGTLLEILRTADSAVGAAVHWLQSQGGGMVAGAGGAKRRKWCELWRFVPDLLAKPVVYVEEEEEQQETAKREEDTTRPPRGRVGNCIWMQTLPTAMQTNILTFLDVEHLHFRAKDLESLARCILSSSTTPAQFWAFRAATTLLDTALSDLGPQVSCLPRDDTAMVGMEEYDALPDWLNDHTEQQDAPFAFLRSGKSTVSMKREQRQASDPSSQQEEISFKANCNLGIKFGEPVNPQGIAQNDGCRIERAEAMDISEETVREVKSAPRINDGSDAVMDTVTTTVSGREASDGNDNSPVVKEEVAARDLGHELFSRAISLRDALRSCQASGLPAEINFTRETPKLPVFLSVVRPWEVEDEVTVLLVESLLTEQDGFAWSTQLLQSILLPKLLALVKPASRMLMTALVEAGKTHPRATMEAVLFPVLCMETGASNVQCEAISRLVKEVLPENVNMSFCERMFVPLAPEPHGSSSGGSWVWTEGMITVVQNLLSQKLNLEQRTIAGLVSALAGAGTEFSTSLKFGNLLLNFITKYRPKLQLHKEILGTVVSRNKTFLTKSLLTKLAAI